jgi:hypothetical protein
VDERANLLVKAAAMILRLIRSYLLALRVAFLTVAFAAPASAAIDLTVPELRDKNESAQPLNRAAPEPSVQPTPPALRLSPHLTVAPDLEGPWSNTIINHRANSFWDLEPMIRFQLPIPP